MKVLKMNKLLCLSILLFLGACTSPQETSTEEDVYALVFPESNHLYKDFPSEIVKPRDVEVWLPEEYERMEALPVLYMFDGQNLFQSYPGWGVAYDPGWQVDRVMDSLINNGVIPPLMVVGISNTGMMRASEYMPAKPRDLIEERISAADPYWQETFKTYGIQSDEQLRFIVEELKPFIDSRYKTKPDRSNTLIAGSSMGGLISAYAICEYPEVFGKAACFSTHWPALDGVFLEYVRENLPDPATHKIYYDYGTIELDAAYEPYQVVVDSLMELRGFQHGVNWTTRRCEGEGHNSAAWHKRFHIPITFLLSDN